ncbi:MAG: Ig-like domain-containing protein [Porticoccaceae bacterium]
MALVDVETGNSREFELPTVSRIGDYRTQQFINSTEREAFFEGALSSVERSGDCGGIYNLQPDAATAPNAHEPATSLLFDGEVVVVADDIVSPGITFYLDGAKSVMSLQRRSGLVRSIGAYTNWLLLDPGDAANFPALPLRQPDPNSSPGAQAGINPTALPVELISEYHRQTATRDPWLGMGDGSGIGYPAVPEQFDVFVSDGYPTGAAWPPAFDLHGESRSGSHLTGGSWYYSSPPEPTSELWYYSSLANQVSKLRARGSAQGIDLLGIAEDQNFLQFELAWANPALPEQWHAIGPAVLESAVDGELMSWTPPAAGQYLLRLRTLDKAGNQREASARAISPAAADITGAHLASRFVSPNGDGVKDRLELSFEVLRPTNLHIEIRNAAGLAVVSEDLQVTSPGPFDWSWDGRSTSGAPAPDGGYRIAVNTWFATGFTVDATPPTVALQRQPANRRALPGKFANVLRERVDLGLAWEVVDVNLESAKLEAGEGASPAHWTLVEETLPGNVSGKRLMREDTSNYRINAIDQAGNRTSSEAAGVPPPDLALVGRWARQQNGSARPWGCTSIGQDDGCMYIPRVDGTYFRGDETFPVESTATIELDLYLAPGTPDTGLALRFRIDRFGSDPVSAGPWQSLPIALQQRSGVELRLSAVAPTLPLGSVIKVQASSRLADGSTLFAEHAAFRYAGISAPIVMIDRNTCVPRGVQIGLTPPTSPAIWVCFEESLLGPVVAPTLTVSHVDGSVSTQAPIRITDGVVLFELDDLANCRDLTARARSGSGRSFESRGECPVTDATHQVRVWPDIQASCDAMPMHRMRYKALVFPLETFDRVNHLKVDFALADGTRRVLLDREDPPEAAFCDAECRLASGLVGEFDASDLPDGRYDMEVTASRTVGSVVHVVRTFFVDRSPVDIEIRGPREGRRECVALGPNLDRFPIDVRTVDASGVLNQYDLANRPMPPAMANWSPPSSSGWKVFGTDGLDEEALLTKQLQAAPTISVDPGVFPHINLPLGPAGGHMQFRLATVNWGGAPQCKLVNFFADDRVEASLGYLPGSVAADIAGVAIVNPVGADAFRTIGVELRADEPLRAGFELWRGDKLASAVRVGTLRPEAAYAQGTHDLSWDGKLADGQRVADGAYWIVVAASDDCGHESGTRLAVPVWVDSTAPTVAFDAPQAGATVASLLVRIEGTVIDLTGGVFELTAQSAVPITIQTKAFGSASTFETSWNRGDISGPVVLRVVATDKVGNRTVSELPIELAPRPTKLFEAAGAVPELISPNGDGAFDGSEIRYALVANADVSARVFSLAGNLLTVLQNAEPKLAGNHSLAWTGQGLPAAGANGAYRIELHAVSAQDPTQFEDLMLSLAVDIAPPQLAIATPNGRFSKGSGPLEVQIDEPHFESANATFAGQTVALAAPGLSTVLELDAFEEGAHNLVLSTRDSVANASSLEREIVIDRTPPVASIDTPAEPAVLGGAATEALIQGSASDANFERYRLSIAAAETPQAQTLLVESTTAVSAGALHTLSLAPADGDYLLTLDATDLAGHQSEVQRAIRIDHTPPLAVLTAPADNAFVSRQFEVRGTASDTNLNDYRLRIATPEQASLGLWSDLLVATESVSDGSLGRVDLLVPDGDYFLELVATDRVAQHAEARIRVHLDSIPPPAPIDLVGNLEGAADVALAWQHQAPADLAGYRVYRDGAVLTPTLVQGRAWIDRSVPSGRLRYEVSALDQAGNESTRSNPVVVVVDRTPPLVDLIDPADAAVVSGVVRIRGTAFSEEDFDRYRLSLLEAATQAPVAVLVESSRAVQGEELAVWDSRAHAEGASLSLLLEAWDRNGNRAEDRVTVSIDNAAPAAPSGLTAIDSNGDGQIDWNANSESDLLGYVLLRDGVPVNGGSIFPDDLRLLAITPNAWLDRGLVDGEHVWIVFAIDRAGNLSPPSDPANLNISRRPPDIAIVSPSAGQRFEGELPVLAASADLDIAEVRFSVRALGDAIWTAIGTDTSLPYEAVWTPGALPFGDYELRAEATDQSGQDDPTPALVPVAYADLTPPSQVIGLAAHAEGGTVLLSWTAVAADDLAHYRVERRQGEFYSFTTVAEVAAGTTTLSDLVPEDREWQYQVTAVDTHGNAGEASGIAMARVFSIDMETPFSPIQQASTALHGQSPVAGQLRVARATGGAPVELLTQPVTSDAFDLAALPLLVGENQLLLTVTDADQNVSRVAEAWVSSGSPPSAPTGLALSVIDHEVTATWNANPEPDVVGYRLFRRDFPALVERDLDDLSVVAAQPADAPQAAIDGDPATAWAANSWFVAGPLEDVWLELTTAEPRQISALSLSWLNGRKPAAFEVQAYSGRAWVRIAAVASVQDAQILRLEAPYRTRQIRIVPTAAMALPGGNYQQSIALAEVMIAEQPLIGATAYVDTLIDGSYPHQVSAVNALGFEGPRSDPVTADVGDAEAPPPVLLSGVVAGRDAQLDWTASGAPDVARYRLLRDGVALAVIDAPGSDYVDTNLANGSYTYTVVALDAFDNASPPSNAVLLTVNVAGPGVPRNLRVLPVPAGAALDIDWQPGEGAATVRYLLRRSEAEPGPYAELAETTALSRRDQPLVNGTRYWYTVEAFDSAGNASGQTAPVSGLPQDQQAPLPPQLSFPVRDGESLNLDTSETVVAGFAEVDAEVSVRRNGGEQQRVRSLSSDSSAEVEGYTEGRLRVAPSGVWLFSDDSIEVNTVENTGLSIDPFRFGRLLGWTRDDRLIHHNGDWLSSSPRGGEVRVLNIPLETVEDARFSSDLRYIVARAVHPHNGSPLRALWLVDQVAGTVRPVAGVDPDTVVFDDLVISEGSGFAAWRAADGEVDLLTLATAQARPIAAATEPVRLSVSPRSGEVLLVQSNAGQLQVERVDRDGQSRLVGLGLSAAWSPDADSYVVAESGGILAFHSERDDTVLRRLDLQADLILDLDWTASGRLLVDTSAGKRRIDPQASFRTAPIALVAGENRLDLLAVDAAGLSQASNPPGIVIRPGSGPSLPDLSLTANDIRFLPAGGVPGQNYAAQILVRNIGAAASAATTLRATLVRPDGSQSQLPNPPSVPALGIGASAGLGLSLGQLDQTGSYWLRVELLVDRPDADPSNHAASQRLLLSASPAPVLDLAVDAASFAPGVAARGRVAVRNNGSAFSGSVRLGIRSQSGEMIASLPTLAVNALAFGAELAQVWQWPTAAVLAGGYSVEADLLDQQDRLLDTRRVDFAVAAVRDLRLDVASERAAYVVGETVRLNASLDYRSGNAIIVSAALRLSLLDAAGNQVFTTTRNLATLLPGVRLQVPASWIAGGAAGIYTVRAELLEAGAVTRQAQGSFLLDAANGMAPVTGTIEPTPAPLIAGRPGQIDYQLNNAAGSALAVDRLRLRLLHSPGLEEVAMASVSGAAPALGELPGRLDIDPDRLPIGDYLAVLDWRNDPGSAPVTLATRSVAVVDGIAPLIVVASPDAGDWVRGRAPLAAQVSDAHSGVDRVEIAIDGGSWRIAPLQPQGQYGADANGLSDGAHRFQVRARDRAGNESISAVRDFQVDNTPPRILIDGVADGDLLNHPVVPVVSIEEAHPGETSITLGADAFVSGSEVSADGSYLLSVVARDLAGNVASASVRFQIDTTAPSLSFITPLDGEQTTLASIEARLQSEPESSVRLGVGGFEQTVLADAAGIATFASVPLVFGSNALQASATDRAGNQGAPVGVQVDRIDNSGAALVGSLVPSAPAFASALPAVLNWQVVNPLTTALLGQTLRIRVVHVASLQTLGEDSFSADLPGSGQAAGSSSFASLGAPLGRYAATLAVQVASDWIQLATAEFDLIDQEAPTLTLLAPAEAALVNGPVNIRASASDGLGSVVAVRYRIDGAAWVGMVPLAGTPDQYQSAPLDLPDADYQLEADAVDNVGNTAVTPLRGFTVDRTAPAIDIANVADGDAYNQAVIPLIQITELHPASQSITLDGQPFVSGTPVADDGQHLLLIDASDAAGNHSARSVSFLIDTTPPVIAFTFPDPGAVVATPVIDVGGLSEADARIEFRLGTNTSTVFADDLGGFVVPGVALALGSNLLEARAIDALGNASAWIERSIDYVPNAGATLAAVLTVSPVDLPLGQLLSAGYTLTNTGAVAISALPMRLLWLRLADQQQLAVHPFALDLAPAAVFSDSVELPSQDTLPGAHLVILEGLLTAADGSQSWQTLASEQVIVRDVLPPVVSVLAPAAGSFVDSGFGLRVSASDLHSSVATVQGLIDSSPIAMSPGAISGEYIVTVTAGSEGPLELSARAIDSAGNAAEAVSRQVIVDLFPPAIEVSGIDQGALTNQPVSLQIAITDVSPVQSSITLDGQPFASGGTVGSDGVHLLRVLATDALDRHSERLLDFSIDRTPPMVRIDLPGDGAIIFADSTRVVGSTEPLAEVSLQVGAFNALLNADAAGIFSIDNVPLQPGLNQIAARATDRAGNVGPEVSIQVERRAQPVVALQGQILIAASKWPNGVPLDAAFVLENIGSADLAQLPVRLEARRRDSQQLLQSADFLIDLSPGAQHSESFVWSTSDWGLGEVEVSLSADLPTLRVPSILDSHSLLMQDREPPALAFEAPTHNAQVHAGDPVRVLATDRLSAIASVELSVDGGAWHELPALDVLAGRYGSPLPVLALGPHRLAARGLDAAGNSAVSADLPIRVVGILPLQVTAPIDGSSTEAVAVDFVGNTSPGVNVHLRRGSDHWQTTAEPDGRFLLAAVPLAAGVNAFTVQAEDAFGNTSAIVPVAVTATALAEPTPVPANDWRALLLLALLLLLLANPQRRRPNQVARP